MLVIRLRRIGRKGDPHYRIVVAEHTAPVQGKFIAEVGHYHPKSKDLALDKDRFLAWLEQGAKPSNTVAKLAEKSGLAHEHIVVKEFHAKPKKKATESAESTKKAQEKPAEISELPEENKSDETPVDSSADSAPKEESEQIQ